MAAIQRTRISSSIGGAFVVAISAALLVGGTGGYLVRAVTSNVSGHSQATVNRPALDNEDLTQAQPGAVAEVPAWVRSYASIAKFSAFKTDQLNRTLEDARASSNVEVPAWVKAYTEKAPAPELNVYQMIENMINDRSVATAQAPGEAPQY